MEKLRVGMIGAGFVAGFHTRAMVQLRSMELTGLHALGGFDALAGWARKHDLGPATIYPTIREMAEHVDAIAIYCPNYLRLEIMEEVAAAKRAGAAFKGVICEKPLGRNVAEARRIVALAEECKLLTAYFENQIFMKAIQTQMRQLEPVQKVMGPLTLTRSAEEHGGPHMAWFWDPTKQGGGVLSDMGCHSIAVGWYVLTPVGKPLTFLEPISVSCDMGLLKWGQPKYREHLLITQGIDYAKTPAEDFATGIITFRNPETGQKVKAQFTDSWMFDKQGLRLFMDGLGPGYAFEVNTLVSPLNIFIGDAAAQAIADQESALEKSTASRGLLSVQTNEADLYGYVDENQDAAESFLNGTHAMLPFSYGLEITRLVMASYMAAERKQTIDLTCLDVQRDLESFVPAIQQGRGRDVL
ncbi:MAG: Gfo/Idh/MocA family oxidoreductase [Deltaproteobacteria bacterium]|nr:Gfo/Idh/MocA family oxidoreductase [Deltaproteobacteria bacterium]